MKRSLKLLLVGGDGRRPLVFPDGVDVCRFGSRRYCGNGACQRALGCIRHGRVDCVVLMVRWLGHPESQTIHAACRRADIDVLRVPGGASLMQSIVRTYVEGVHHG